MTERDLLNLKDEIDEAKSSVAELKGQQTVLMKQLKDTYGCQSTEEAEALIAKWKKDIDKLQVKIDEGIKELEEKYNV
jgi:ribosomal protein L9